MLIRKGRKVSRIIGCILLTLTVFAVTGFALLVSLGSGVVTKRKPQHWDSGGLMNVTLRRRLVF
jgi:hypothetical protein